MNVEEGWRRKGGGKEGKKEVDDQEGLCKCGSKVVRWDGVDKTELWGGKEEKQKEKEFFLFSSSGPWDGGTRVIAISQKKHTSTVHTVRVETHTHIFPSSIRRTQIHTLLFSTP
jgi:hypothetical protein